MKLKKRLNKALTQLYRMEDVLDYDETTQGVIVGKAINKLQKLIGDLNVIKPSPKYRKKKGCKYGNL